MAGFRRSSGSNDAAVVNQSRFYRPFRPRKQSTWSSSPKREVPSRVRGRRPDLESGTAPKSAHSTFGSQPGRALMTPTEYPKSGRPIELGTCAFARPTMTNYTANCTTLAPLPTAVVTIQPWPAVVPRHSCAANVVESVVVQRRLHAGLARFDRQQSLSAALSKKCRQSSWTT